MKISVIIPCYLLKDEWLGRLFQSLKDQTIGFHNLEVIFVIDCSPDDTFERIKRYEEQYPENILVINSNEKIGPGGARSLGMQYATGEYLAFIDQDDWVEPCMYEHLYAPAVEYDCDMVEAYNTRDKDFAYHTTAPRKTGQADRFYDVSTPALKKLYFSQDRPERRKYWAKIYKRDFLLANGIGFPDNLKYDDNFFKGLSFYMARRIYVVEEYLYHWMINSSSISMTADYSGHLDRLKVELAKIEEYQKRDLFTLYYQEMEYIFLEQFYANTMNTIATRMGGVSWELFDYMKQTVLRLFPDYRNNIYIAQRQPVWSAGQWLENAMKGIAQVTGREIQVPDDVLAVIRDCSFLDLLEAPLGEAELNWYLAIYVAFDKIASQIDYSLLS